MNILTLCVGLLLQQSDRVFPKVWEPLCRILLCRTGCPDRHSHFRLPTWSGRARIGCWEEINVFLAPVLNLGEVSEGDLRSAVSL